VNPWLFLLLATLGVIAAALVGAALSLASRGNARRLEVFLAASAGVMLGIVGGHMLPEAFEEGGPQIAWAVVAGFVAILVIERFVLPHAAHSPHAGEEHAHCDPQVEREHVKRDAAGIGAFVGLALHTMGDGIALGAALHDTRVATFVFVAIVLHKMPTSFALGSILLRGGAKTRRILATATTLGLTVGLGGVLFLVASRAGTFDSAGFMPWAVGFSAGSFLHVAVTDLLPDLHRAGAERTKLALALIGGLVGMVVLGHLFE
jgi:zinc and cadmium transporter